MFRIPYGYCVNQKIRVMHKNLYIQGKCHNRQSRRLSRWNGFMEFVIISPDILFPALEITAEIAHPEGILTWPSIFIDPVPFLIK